MMLTPKQNPRWCLERWPKDPSIQMQKGWFLFLSAIQNVLLFVCCCFFSFFLSASLFLFTFFLCFLPCFFCYVFHSIIYVFSLLFLPFCLIIYLKKILNRHKMRHWPYLFFFVTAMPLTDPYLIDLLQDPKTHYRSTLVNTMSPLTTNMDSEPSEAARSNSLLWLMGSLPTWTMLVPRLISPYRTSLAGSTWTPPQAIPVQDKNSNVLLDGDLFWSHAAGYGRQCQVQPGPCDPPSTDLGPLWVLLFTSDLPEELYLNTCVCVCVCMCVCEHACVLQIQKSWSCN